MNPPQPLLGVKSARLAGLLNNPLNERLELSDATRIGSHGQIPVCTHISSTHFSADAPEKWWWPRRDHTTNERTPHSNLMHFSAALSGQMQRQTPDLQCQESL